MLNKSGESTMWGWKSRAPHSAFVGGDEEEACLVYLDEIIICKYYQNIVLSFQAVTFMVFQLKKEGFFCVCPIFAGTHQNFWIASF